MYELFGKLTKKSWHIYTIMPKFAAHITKKLKT